MDPARVHLVSYNDAVLASRKSTQPNGFLGPEGRFHVRKQK